MDLQDIIDFQVASQEEFQRRIETFEERLEEARQELSEGIWGSEEDEEEG